MSLEVIELVGPLLPWKQGPCLQEGDYHESTLQQQLEERPSDGLSVLRA